MGHVVDALREHIEWAPVEKLTGAGLLEALGFLMSTPDFRLSACTCMRALGARKQEKVHAHSPIPPLSCEWRMHDTLLPEDMSCTCFLSPPRLLVLPGPYVRSRFERQFLVGRRLATAHLS